MSPRTNPESEDNIKRIDSKKLKTGKGETHGFQVYFKRQRVEYTRFFAAHKSGGKEKARQMARKFREILKESIPPPIHLGAANLGPARSNTGQMGLSFKEDPRKSGKVALYILASASVAPGVSKRRSFPVGTRNVKEVIREALGWRETLLEERARLESQETNKRDVL